MFRSLPHHSPIADSRRQALKGAGRRSGFTLIELLMVIAVILILAGITFGISRGVQNAQARAQAKAELAVIAQALEQFKSRYGDYPWHDAARSDYPDNQSGEVTSTMLLYALTGRMVMERQSNGSLSVSKVADSMNDPEVQRNPKFLDHEKFNYSGTSERPEALVDPWGNPYIYWYKWEDTENSAPTWDVFGYHLYSTGPNTSEADAALRSVINDATGVLDDNFRTVVEQEGIIFAGE